MKKGWIAPIIITVIVLMWLVGYLAVCIMTPIPLWMKGVGILVLLVLMGFSVAMLIERIREVESGEEDDLDQY